MEHKPTHDELLKAFLSMLNNKEISQIPKTSQENSHKIEEMVEDLKKAMLRRDS